MDPKVIDVETYFHNLLLSIEAEMNTYSGLNEELKNSILQKVFSLMV